MKYLFSFLHKFSLTLDSFQSTVLHQCFTFTYIQYVWLAILHIFTVAFHWTIGLLLLGFCVADLCGNYNIMLLCCMDRLQVYDLLLHWLCGLHVLLFLWLFFNNAGMYNDLLLLQLILQFPHFHHSAFFYQSLVFWLFLA